MGNEFLNYEKFDKAEHTFVAAIKSNNMKKLYILLLLLCLKISLVAQCTNQVLNLTGTSTVSGIQVAVTSTGGVSSNTIYCSATKPYWIGFTGSAHLTGSYVFNFNPPISGLTLNFSGLTDVVTSKEEIILFVNNAHYSVTTAGTANGCDNLAVITSSGNVAPCAGCNGSGWNGTNIIGPISKLEVKDSVLAGTPNGSLFSLFICSSIGIWESEIIVTNKLFPNPNNGSFKLKIENLMQSGEIVLFNSFGQKVHEQKISQGENDIITPNLVSGFYNYIILRDKVQISNGKMMVE